jgi:ABC-type dipeptide/oligopeptide/nickel transport system permease subunit
MNADKTLLTPLCKRLGTTLSRRGMLFVGLGIVIIMSAAALLAPWLSPYDPTALHLKSILVPPSAQFPLGTDALGRDVLSRLLYGARVSLWVGFVSVSISIAIGIALGLLAGYFRGIVDEIIMRGVDVMLCFPSFFLILAVIAFLEPSLNTIMVVIGLTSWMGVARLVRGNPLPARTGFCRGRPVGRYPPFLHHGHAYPSQCTHPCSCLRHTRHRRGHFGGVFAQLSRARRPAAGSQLGKHADGR